MLELKLKKKSFFSKGPHSKIQTPIQLIFFQLKTKERSLEQKKSKLALKIRKIIGSKVCIIFKNCKKC